jgi:ferredoxin-NADP reductase
VDSPDKDIISIQPTTLANWVKQHMEEAGVDTSKCKAHSIRSAASTKAKELGFSTSTIKQHANWSENSNTFERY